MTNKDSHTHNPSFPEVNLELVELRMDMHLGTGSSLTRGMALEEEEHLVDMDFLVMAGQQDTFLMVPHLLAVLLADLAAHHRGLVPDGILRDDNCL